MMRDHANAIRVLRVISFALGALRSVDARLNSVSSQEWNSTHRVEFPLMSGNCQMEFPLRISTPSGNFHSEWNSTQRVEFPLARRILHKNASTACACTRARHFMSGISTPSGNSICEDTFPEWNSTRWISTQTSGNSTPARTH